MGSIVGDSDPEWYHDDGEKEASSPSTGRQTTKCTLATSVATKRTSPPDSASSAKRRCVRSSDVGDHTTHQQADSTSKQLQFQLGQEDRVPRARKSSTWNARNKLATNAGSVVNTLPPFPVRETDSWDAILAAATEYEAKHYAHYRWKESRCTKTHNSRPNSQEIPKDFPWVFRVFQCTHGCRQATRSTGLRARKSRYTGCKARFSAKVVQVPVEDGPDKWVVRVFNETRTHNHISNLAIASTYLGAASIDVRPDVGDRVVDMVNVGGEPRKITQFLADSLERPVTPQQARNIINRLLGKSSAEQRLKRLLDALTEKDGSSVLLVQDQMSITSAIVIQTAMQKAIFAKWGESLLMDWTHSTNNLGYHLGSLLVTSPTGRGIPVIDFISLNEQAVTMEHILNFFKAKNPGWKKVETVVIDKDFVEWRVLERCFPHVVVLLCQYHAITYWKKLLRRRQFDLRIAQRERLQSFFMQMLKSYSESAFEESYTEFKDYCEADCPNILAYFDKNWRTCRGMWASYARARHFSAGNTTTNRVEANWNQLKALLGYRPGLDRTIAGLLCHQIAVVRQFSSALSQYASRTRQANAVPKYLRSVSSVLSDYTYHRVRREWDLLHTVMNGARCVRTGNSTKWEVISNYHIYVCDMSDWSCTCLFHSSIKLPCRHLLLIARDGLQLEEFPANAVVPRWNVGADPALFEALEDGVYGISAALDVVSVVPSKKHFVADGDTSTKTPDTLLGNGGTSTIGAASSSDLSGDADTPSASSLPCITPRSRKSSSVEFVRLRRKEKADMVVLSSAEKYRYALATLEPLLNQLSNMSSQQFYEHIGRWNTLLAKSLQSNEAVGDSTESLASDDIVGNSSDGHVESADRNGSQDASWEKEDADSYTFFELFEFGAKDDEPIGEVDADTNPHYLTGVRAPDQFPRSDTIAPPVDECPTTTEQDVIDLCDIDPPNKKDSRQSVGGICAREVSRGAIEVLRLPASKKRTNTRKSTKQTELVPAPRKAIVSWPRISVSLSELLRWAKVTPNLKFVKSILDAYPRAMDDAFLFGREPVCRREEVCQADFDYSFVVPAEIARTMERAIKEERAQDRRHQRTVSCNKELQPDKSTELVVSYGELRKKFTWLAVCRLTNFFSIAKLCTAWEKDVSWLAMSWNHENNEVELFGLETSDNVEREGGRDRGCAADALVKYKSASLQTAFMLPSGNFSVDFSKVIGSVVRNCFLTDSVIQMCLQAMCDMRNGCRVFESRSGLGSWPSTPVIPSQRTPTGDEIVEDLSLMKYLVYPCNILAEHWTLIVVKVNIAKEISVFLYDPIGDYEEETKSEWENGMLLFIQRWHQDWIKQRKEWNKDRVATNQQSLPLPKFPKVKKVTMRKPIQPDGSCCGVMILAQAYAILNNLTGFNSKRSVTMAYVRSMRLRTLWMILCYSSERKLPAERRDSCKDIHNQLIKYFG